MADNIVEDILKIAKKYQIEQESDTRTQEKKSGQKVMLDGTGPAYLGGTRPVVVAPPSNSVQSLATAMDTVSPAGGAKTWEDMQKYTEAAEQQGAVQQAHYETKILMNNVMDDPEEQDKPGLLQRIAAGFGSRLKAIMSGKAFKAVTKTEDGAEFKASDYASVPDPDKPSSWKLRLAEEKSGNFTVAQVARAITAMQPSGFRGEKVQLSPDEKSKAVSRIRSAISKAKPTEAQRQNLMARLDKIKEFASFKVLKDVAGNWRWISTVSNQFRDREGEIFSEDAHKEFVNYLDETGNYPDLWAWHEPLKWGQCDFAEYTHGFLVMSGTIDEGFEDVAEKMAESDEIAVSHGYHYRGKDLVDGVYQRYRMFEVSPLPFERAANMWTSFETISQEVKEMRADKRSFLEKYFGAERVAAAEGNWAELEKELKDQGVAYKENGDAAAAEEPAEKETAPAEAKVEVENKVYQLDEDTTKAVKTMAEKLPEIIERLEKLEKDDDAKIADALEAAKEKSAYVPSAAKDNEVSAEEKEETDKAKPDTSWFSDAIAQSPLGPQAAQAKPEEPPVETA